VDVNWRGSAIEIWKAEAHGVMKREPIFLWILGMVAISPKSVASFWEGWKDDNFQPNGAAPPQCGIVFCEGIILREKVG